MLTNCQEPSEGLKCARGRTQNVHQIQNKTSKFDHIQTRYAVSRWPLHHCGYNTVKKQSCICLGDRKKSIHSPIYKHPLIFTECNLKPGPHKVKNTKMRRWNFLGARGRISALTPAEQSFHRGTAPQPFSYILTNYHHLSDYFSNASCDHQNL